MGTSSLYGGPANGLVPSWVDGGDAGAGDQDAATSSPGDGKLQANGQPGALDIGPRSGFSKPRANFTRFTNSGNEKSLSRAISGYLASTGGGKRAAQRMPSSTHVASGIARLANSFISESPNKALQQFELQGMAGRPAVDVLDALADLLCPDGGTIDEAIARDAMLETIAEFATEDLGDFEDLTADQLKEFLAEVVTRCVETKVINEIGTNSLHGSASDSDFREAEAILHDYTSQAVHDALSDVFGPTETLESTEMDVRMADVFADAFRILATILEAL